MFIMELRTLLMDCKIEIDIENSTSFVTANGEIYKDYMVGDGYLYVGPNDRKKYIFTGTSSLKKQRDKLAEENPECFL